MPSAASELNTIENMTSRDSSTRKPPELPRNREKFFLLIVFTSLIAQSSASLNDSLEQFTTGPPPSAIMSAPADGICQDIFIRFEIDKIHALHGCRIVEGSVAILLMDEVKEKDVRNISFPELVEITGYLMLYRISGFKSLSKLFPNLAIIRGRDLFKDYSLIIYEMIELNDIGLSNLVEIERGNVRIEKNEMLCYVDTVNWKQITAMTYEPYLEKNKISLACPVCTDKCRGSKTHCWSEDKCQRSCNCSPGVICSPKGKCCSPNCAGGCDDTNPMKCTSCKKFSIGAPSNVTCVNECPKGTFAYRDLRCLSSNECYELNTAIASDSSVANPDNFYFPFNAACLQECPPGHSRTGRGNTTTCTPCKDKCLKRCPSKIIDSIASAQSLKGCSIIEGHLEIQIRGSTKNPEAGNNIVKELEANLIDIIEINEYLKIARSHPILSLSFLKNLKKIHGKKLENSKNALVVWENQNLQELWNINQTVEIGGGGKLFFHFNPKLCFYKIEEFAEKIAPRVQPNETIVNFETAKLSNGDKTACKVASLPVTIEHIYPQAVLISWMPLLLDDDRSLLNYVVYYIAAPDGKNVTLWDGRNACGNDDWNVEDVNTFSSTQKIDQPITKLEPYTRYAFYVKAFTLATEQKGAQSTILYFTTKPAQPAKMRAPKLTALGSDRIEVKWETPKKVNGQLDHYKLRAKALDQTSFSERNYCVDEPSQAQSQAPQQKETPKPSGPVAPEGKCDCKVCSKLCSSTDQSPIDDDERQSENDFEDQIQDFVYVQNPDVGNEELPKEIAPARKKRQIPNELTDDSKLEMPPQSDSKPMGPSDFYDPHIPANVTSFVITNLTHFRTYIISIWACRKLEIGESLNSTELCSYESNEYSQTFKEPSKDNIPTFSAEKFFNGTSYGILVTWTPPEHPNGLLLSYQIRYKRVEDTSLSQICVPGNLNRHIIPKETIHPGNYSIEMQAKSLAGNGEFTKMVYVDIEEPSSGQLWTILTFLTIALIGILAAICFFFKHVYIPNISSMKLIANVNPVYSIVPYKQDEWEIPREKVVQLQELGQGSFGMVYEGLIKDFQKPGEEMACAIKTVNESATDKERISFLNEASVMKQFDTFHVVRLIGVVSQGQPAFVIMELMANGDLKGYLRSHRPEYDTGTESPQPPTLRQILQMAIEIADGMAYLSAKKFVHRDLAARNCMVADDLTVKIGDFGMTRDIYETDYYRKGSKGLLPVRWMSPESLKDGVFTSNTDVFSFGVVLWEMATLASQPYQGLSNDQVLRYVIEGGVMERPENCPDKLYELMRRCWQHRPTARPSFMDIITLLLSDVNDKFHAVSFYHSNHGQEILYQQSQAIQITDDVTTPLRQGEEETSSVEGNRYLMNEFKNGSVGDI